MGVDHTGAQFQILSKKFRTFSSWNKKTSVAFSIHLRNTYVQLTRQASCKTKTKKNKHNLAGNRTADKKGLPCALTESVTLSQNGYGASITFSNSAIAKKISSKKKREKKSARCC
tara:strand:+ start:506 stop:850 length:345 start_codon:yes stop_codon:yes gene_type:complete